MFSKQCLIHHSIKSLTFLIGYRFKKGFNTTHVFLVYKSLNNSTPEYISEIISKPSITHQRHLRSTDNDLLYVPRSSTACFYKSYSICGHKEWNKLPLEIRLSKTLSSFKKLLKMHLMSLSIRTYLSPEHT